MFKKLISTILIKSTESSKPSYTATTFLYGFLIVNIKLLIAGITLFGQYKSSDFNGTDYATAIGALGALYVSNKHVTNIQTNKEKELNNKDSNNT